MKRIFKAGFAVSALSVMALVLAAASNPKATGDIQWVNTSLTPALRAHVVFNAIGTTAEGTDAKGSLLYEDGTYEYTMDVKYLKVEGNTAWLAGLVTHSPGAQGCCAVDHWIFYKVEDNGEPGIYRDTIRGEDLGAVDSSVALNKVRERANPASDAFEIMGGNLQVHKK